MNISLKEISNKKSGFTFSSLPETIKVRSGARYQSYEMIGKGVVKIPKGTEPETISWSGVFFGASKKRERIVKEKKWKTPKYCKQALTRWMEKGTILRLLVTGTNINYDVTIGEFEYEEYGPHGNARYTVVFYRYRPLKVYTTTELDISAYKKTVPRSEPEPAGSHTVASGDTLWKIAKQYLGGGMEWPKVYEANSDVIEDAAKQHGKASSDNGYWIYPGTVLAIP